MKRLTRDDCIPIGEFLKPYKFSGTILLSFDPVWETSLIRTGMLMTETDGSPVPWFVCENGISLTGPGKALVDLLWINDEESARKLCGMKVLIAKSSVHTPVAKQVPADWSGYILEDIQTGVIGLIISENNYAGNVVLTVEREKSTLLVPFHPDLMVCADHRLKVLTLRLPGGL